MGNRLWAAALLMRSSCASKKTTLKHVCITLTVRVLPQFIKPSHLIATSTLTVHAPPFHQPIPLNCHINLDGACSPISSTPPTSNHNISLDGACCPTVYQAIPLNYHTNLDGACSPILSTHPTSNHSISLDSACSPIELTRPTFNSQVILVVITTSTLALLVPSAYRPVPLLFATSFAFLLLVYLSVRSLIAKRNHLHLTPTSGTK